MTSSIRGALLHVGDEEGFISFAEKVVYEIQRLWRAKEGMDTYAVIDACARLEELIYQDAMREFSLPATSHVWNKRESMILYQEKCEELVRCIEYKPLNWKKIFEDNEKNSRVLLNIITKGEDAKVLKKSSSTISLNLLKKKKATPSKKSSAEPKLPAKKPSDASSLSVKKSTSNVSGKPLQVEEVFDSTSVNESSSYAVAAMKSHGVSETTSATYLVNEEDVGELEYNFHENDDMLEVDVIENENAWLG